MMSRELFQILVGYGHHTGGRSTSWRLMHEAALNILSADSFRAVTTSCCESSVRALLIRVKILAPCRRSSEMAFIPALLFSAYLVPFVVTFAFVFRTQRAEA